MTFTLRQFVWAAVAVTALVVVVDEWGKSTAPELVQADPSRGAPPAATAPASAALTRAPIALPERDPFAPASTAAPPPPAPVPAARVEPVREPAPPVPYRFMARVTGVDGKETVYLTRESRVVEAAAGQVLDQQYRVDRVDAESIVLTYLPLQEQQVILAR